MNISLGRTIISLTLGGALLLTVVFLWIGIQHSTDLIDQAEQRELKAKLALVQSTLKERAAMARALADMVAHLPSVQASFATDDRDALLIQLEQAFAHLKQNVGVRQFQFHTPPAISYLRLHKPEKFGDDLSSFRHTVVEANTTRAAIVGIEKGVAGFGIRGVVPVFHQGSHLGSVELGLSLGQALIDEFKNEHGIDLAIHTLQDGALKSFAASFQEAGPVDNGFLKKAMKEVSIRTSVIDGNAAAILGAPLRDYSGQVVGVIEVATDRQYYVDASAKVITATAIIGLITLLIAVTISVVITRLVSRPINRVIDSIQHVSQGDLTHELPSGHELLTEAEKLRTSMKEMVVNLASVITGVRQTSGQLGSAARHLTDMATDNRESAIRQKNQTEQSSSAIAEMSVSFHQVAGSAEETAELSKVARAHAAEGVRRSAAAITRMNTLAAEIARTADDVQAFSQKAANVGTVLEVINGIADQTNLLALNAAIEAARAGEQGRGFAVVADEVRTLASRTGQSIKQVEEIISQLQSGATSAAGSMNAASATLADSVAGVGLVSDALHAIAESIEKTVGRNTEVASASEQQSVVAQAIAESIQEISDLAEKGSGIADNTALSAHDVATLAENLHASVAQFRV